MMSSVDQLAAEAAEKMQLYEKEKEISERKKEAAKHQQNTSLQDKLNARIKKKEEKRRLEEEKNEKDRLRLEGLLKVDAPTGSITFGYIVIKNMAALWETMEEESALKVLEDIHDLVSKELVPLNIYLVKEEIGKFLLASEKMEDMINLAMKIQVNFNENQWKSDILQVECCKKLVRPEDTKIENAKPLFNGPRIQIGIHRGDASMKKDANGHVSYSGISVLKVESIGNFAQPGQVLISPETWNDVDKTKLSEHEVTEPGVYKLEGFSSGCKVCEVLPASLKDRSKFFGSVCAHCNDVIKPNEQFFKALNCIWHIHHFRCFKCNTDLGGSFVEHEGLPYCKQCYLSQNAPKCKNCSNPITGAYINALGGYWHAECFSCRQCLRKPSPDIQMYDKDGFPFCGDCYKKTLSSS